jgi:hypothetical protein
MHGFLLQNFVRLYKDFQVMQRATRAQNLLIQSMILMDQQVQQKVTDKMKIMSTGFGGKTKTSNNNGEEQVHLPTRLQAILQNQYLQQTIP